MGGELEKIQLRITNPNTLPLGITNPQQQSQQQQNIECYSVIFSGDRTLDGPCPRSFYQEEDWQGQAHGVSLSPSKEDTLEVGIQ